MMGFASSTFTLDIAFLKHCREALARLSLTDVRVISTVAATILVLVLAYRLLRKGNGEPECGAWLFVEGQVVSIALEKGGWLLWVVNFLRCHSSSIVYGATHSHAVVANSELGLAVLRRPHTVVNNAQLQWLLSRRVFGSSPGMSGRFFEHAPSLLDAVSRNTVQEGRLRPVMARMHTLAGRLIGDLVPNPSKQPSISASSALAVSRASSSQPLPPNPRRPWLAASKPVLLVDGTVEADLFLLARDLTAQISLSLLAGDDLLQTSPHMVSDLFALDDAFVPLAFGVPAWVPLPGVRRAAAARRRLLSAIAGFAARVDAVGTGSADDFAVKRMEGVNGTFYDRAVIYRAAGLSYAERAEMDLPLIWALNANTSPFVFWLLAYLTNSHEALEAVRAEVAPFVWLDQTQTVDSSASFDPKILSCDSEALLHRCPRLKAAYLETFRLASAPTSVRQLVTDLTLPDPAAPGRVLRFKRGMFISVPHAVLQRDSSLWPEPEEWRPERFLTRVVDDESDTAQKANLATGRSSPKESKPAERDARPVSLAEAGPFKAIYGSLKPWGDGPHQCRGRVFAEREVLVLAALFVSAWDIQPLVKGMPGQRPGTGVSVPDRSMRVRLRWRLGT